MAMAEIVAGTGRFPVAYPDKQRLSAGHASRRAVRYAALRPCQGFTAINRRRGGNSNGRGNRGPPAVSVRVRADAAGGCYLKHEYQHEQ